MIDTIILRIHNIDKYKTIYEKFYNPTKKKHSQTVAVVDESTGLLEETTYTNALLFHDTDRVLPLIHRNNISLPSNHYSVSYKADFNKKEIEFNFSIPKYEYSTNVMQFISMYDQGYMMCFKMLVVFIKDFIKQTFDQEPIMEDVEINRIDLCYNQFFLKKEDALTYLDEQKKLLVKYARSSKNNFRSYDTSLMYITQRYSFKIYHKGTEFKKNDYRELVKNGNPKNLPLQELQEHADCILRYEMTFRNTMLQYLTKHHFFISSDKALYPEYAFHPVSKFYRSLVSNGLMKEYEKKKNRKMIFTLKSVFDTTRNIEFLYNSDAVTFDETIFRICFDTFWKKVNDYQLSEAVNVPNLAAQIKRYNDDNKIKRHYTSKQVNDKNVSRILTAALLSHYHNIDDLKNYLPQRTFYRMKADLKKVGLSSLNCHLGFPKPSLDYSDYKIYFSKFH